MSGCAIGIDIGGTNTKIGIVTSKGELLCFEKFPTKEPESFEAFTKKVKEVCERLLKEEGMAFKSIHGIGVGAPNGNAKTGMIESPPNIKEWGSVDLVGPFNQIFNRDVKLDNDANVAAIGEGKWGAARQMKDYIVVTLGTGIGTGVVADGKIIRGGNGLAGEGGHIIIEPNGRECGCGGKGHLETYGSVRGIKLTVKEMLGKDMSFAQISEAYHAGDQTIIKALERTADYLGKGLAAMGSLMAPEAFILAGGVATIGEVFRKNTEESLNRYIYPPFRGQVKVLLSHISTGEGAVLGAASMAF